MVHDRLEPDASRTGIKPNPLHWLGKFLTTEPPGKSSTAGFMHNSKKIICQSMLSCLEYSSNYGAVLLITS